MSETHGKGGESMIRIEFAERVGRERIQRRDGFMYVVADEGDVVCIELPFSQQSERFVVSQRKVPIMAGFRYFVDKDGYVARVPIKDLGGRPTGGIAPAAR